MTQAANHDSSRIQEQSYFRYKKGFGWQKKMAPKLFHFYKVYRSQKWMVPTINTPFFENISSATYAPTLLYN